MSNVIATIDKDFSEKIQDELLARVEMEVRFLIRPDSTKRFIRNLYQEANGKIPPARLNLLDWFFANHRYDDELKSWTQLMPVFH